ncbi:sulfite exporter TauE/SafE family protein [Pleionea litopenaei]|uniref:Probable membrane transporter protein n=1 Tax=Pleionea litopenaei TaxID=3070815 RepID=A0AA51RQN0_9GAMM|nr:sulfite exporter TauE/SafE family protein [Pleionea sp. HL-JVS1]WMS85753.1 sulfite exporter TauE/SafE family protein [Pleionea sp. HL-JVS1]
MEWLVYLIIGAVAGLMAGLLGIGGGFIIVPALLVLLPLFGVDSSIVMQAAVGTSLATIVVTSLSSLLAHHRKQSVDWWMVKRLVPGIFIGGLLSGWVADSLSSDTLGIIFGCGSLGMAFQIWWAKQPHQARTTPGMVQVAGVSMAIGTASGLVGIGGGSLIVPYLHVLGEKITRCIGTAAACGLPLAAAGALSYAIMGSHAPMPEFSLGYIYLPAFLGIIVASIVTAPIGAKLAHRLPAQKLKKLFALFLLFVGVRIIYKFLG